MCGGFTSLKAGLEKVLGGGRRRLRADLNGGFRLVLLQYSCFFNNFRGNGLGVNCFTDAAAFWSENYSRLNILGTYLFEDWNYHFGKWENWMIL